MPRRTLTQHALSAAAKTDDYFDRAIQKLRGKGGDRPPTIVPYTGFASQSEIVLRGRVLRNPPRKPNYDRARRWHNLRSTLRRFASDEVPDVSVVGHFAGAEVVGKTDAEGYFRLITPRTEAAGDLPYWSDATLRIESDGEPVDCKVLATPTEATLGVISDIDDTILHTGATSLLTTLRLTLFGNARTRAPLDGVATLYKELVSRGDDSEPVNPIYYVSSSPWNLYDLLDDFLRLNDIPYGPLLLRDFGIDQDKFIAAGHGHKLDKVREVMSLENRLPFVLFGDSGQDDPTIYADAAEEFGDRIRAIFIRDIHPQRSTNADEKVRECRTRAQRVGVPMRLVGDSIEAAKYAVDFGLLCETSLDAISQATQADRKRLAGALRP